MSDTSNKENTPSNFIRAIIERIWRKIICYKKWGGSPGDSAHHEKGILIC